MKEIITRFAPSPTGNLHLGSIRTALINFIVTKQAKKEYPNSKFLLRIEDTDKERSKNEFFENIISGLEWMKIIWDDDIYIQSEKIERHKEIAFKLLEEKKAFKCNCTQEKLENQRKINLQKKISLKRLCINCEQDEKIQKLEDNFCIRIKIPNDNFFIIEDLIQGKIQVSNNEIDNYVILRKNKTPTYMLSVVVDDHDMKVNNIIRGDDHLNNAFRQAHLYKSLDWNLPKFSHIPLIHGSDGAKLSKRHGSIDVLEIKKIGFLPQSILNTLILLGWSPNKKNEIIEIEEIIEKFNIQNLSKSSSIFDFDKLDFFNNYYLQKKENEKYLDSFIKNNNKINYYLIENKEKFMYIFDIYKNKIKRLNELEEIMRIYFDKDFKFSSEEKIDNEFKNIIAKFLLKIEVLEKWDIENIESNIKKFLEKEKIKFSEFGKNLRLILTNLKNGPSLSNIIFLLGQNKVKIRIKEFLIS